MLNVDDGVGRSYYETHRRKQGVTPELLAKESLMTDRGAYLSFLEVQLERVSAACLTAQGFEERINGITEITHSSEEKVISLAKLVQLTNTCAEERSREVANAFTNVDARVKSVEVNNDARGREHLEAMSRMTDLEARMRDGERFRAEQAKSTQAALDRLEQNHLAALSRLERQHREDLQRAAEKTAQDIAAVRRDSEDLIKSQRRRCEEIEERCTTSERGITELSAALTEEKSQREAAVDALHVMINRRLEENDQRVQLLESRVEAEVGKLRNEAGVSENRVLTALSKQSMVNQDQVTKIQELIAEAITGGTFGSVPASYAAPTVISTSRGRSPQRVGAGRDGGVGESVTEDGGPSSSSMTPTRGISSTELLSAVTDPRTPSLRSQVTELAKRVEQTNQLVTSLDADLRREAAKAIEAGEEAAALSHSLRESVGSAERMSGELEQRVLNQAGEQRQTVLNAVNSLERRIEREVQAVPSSSQISSMFDQKIAHFQSIVDGAERRFVVLEESTRTTRDDAQHLQSTLGERLSTVEMSVAKAARDAAEARVFSDEFVRSHGTKEMELSEAMQGVKETQRQLISIAEELDDLKQRLPEVHFARLERKAQAESAKFDAMRSHHSESYGPYSTVDTAGVMGGPAMYAKQFSSGDNVVHNNHTDYPPAPPPPPPPVAAVSTDPPGQRSTVQQQSREETYSRDLAGYTGDSSTTSLANISTRAIIGDAPEGEHSERKTTDQQFTSKHFSPRTGLIDHVPPPASDVREAARTLPEQHSSRPEIRNPPAIAKPRTVPHEAAIAHHSNASMQLLAPPTTVKASAAEPRALRPGRTYWRVLKVAQPLRGRAVSSAPPTEAAEQQNSREEEDEDITDESEDEVPLGAPITPLVQVDPGSGCSVDMHVPPPLEQEHGAQATSFDSPTTSPEWNCLSQDMKAQMNPTTYNPHESVPFETPLCDTQVTEASSGGTQQLQHPNSDRENTLQTDAYIATFASRERDFAVSTDARSSPFSSTSDEGQTTTIHHQTSSRLGAVSSSPTKKKGTNVVVSASKRRSKITVGGKDYTITVTPGATSARKKSSAKSSSIVKKKRKKLPSTLMSTRSVSGGGPGNLRGHVRLGRSNRVSSPSRRVMHTDGNGVSGNSGRVTWLPAGPNLTHGSSAAVTGDRVSASQSMGFLRERHAKETRLAERNRSTYSQQQQQHQGDVS